MYSIQPPLLAFKDFLASDTNDRLVMVLSALDLEPLLLKLDRRRGRGRRGYSQRSMLYAVIAGWVYNLHSMADLRRELCRNGSLRILCGINSVGQVPSEDAFSRFFARLAEHKADLQAEYAKLIDKIRELAPEVGEKVAIDSTAINAWSDGNRKQAADPDAGWGCKGHQSKGKSKWWFGYKLHIAADTPAELALAFDVTPANEADGTQMEALLAELDKLLPEGHLKAVMADAAYDSKANYAAVWSRGALPIIDFNARGWAAPAGYTEKGQPLCDCGRPMRFLGRDRAYLKYGSGKDCTCRDGKLIRRLRIDDNPRLHAPLPRHTLKWARLYNERSAVERVNSRGKEHLRLRTLKHRGADKAYLHCWLSMAVAAAGCLGAMQIGRRDWARSVVQLVA
ncbi:MAG TPA: transposase [Candidatus Saccharimonadales bacterium]|nr:transposase [Candidatus Saccharimonadales bacterium]